MCDLPHGSGRCRAGLATPSPGPTCGGSWGPATGHRGLQLSPTVTARTRGPGGRPCSDEVWALGQVQAESRPRLSGASGEERSPGDGLQDGLR